MSSRVHPAASLFPLLLAGLLAGMAFWLEQASRPPSGNNDAKLRHDPDYLIENFHLRRFDTEGALQHTLLGDQMRHYPDDDSTMVVNPRLTYHRDPPTFITAHKAFVDGNGEHVQLVRDVRVARGGKPGKPDTVITAEHLDAYPDAEIATTDVPVTITQGKSNIQGSGLNANNKTLIYILEGPVRGIFFRNGGMAISRQPAGIANSLVMPSSPPGTPAIPASLSKPQPKSKTPPKPQPKPQAKVTAKPKPKPKPKPAPITTR